jgi:hypothetical protein
MLCLMSVVAECTFRFAPPGAPTQSVKAHVDGEDRQRSATRIV